MYEQYRLDPSSVSESWREFFADYVPPGVMTRPRRPGSPPRPHPTAAPRSSRPAMARPRSGRGWSLPPRTAAPPGRRAGCRRRAQLPPPRPTRSLPPARAVPSGTAVEPVALRGAAGRIVSNMEASLAVPTATSVRTVPAKLLEVNRALLNQHLVRASGTKVSFTHLIGFALVRALEAVPSLNAAFVADIDGKGTPGVARHDQVGLGLAVDLVKRDGSRTLVVPVVRDAGRLDFRAFVVAYEDLVRKVHSGRMSPDDFVGATVTLTNPGTLGTVQSVPRLMPGQGAIIGVGSLGFPAEYQGADRRSLASLGVGPVVTLAIRDLAPSKKKKRDICGLKICQNRSRAIRFSTT